MSAASPAPSPLPHMLIRTAPVGLDGVMPMESFMSWSIRLAWANGFRALSNLLRAQGIAWQGNTDVGPQSHRLEVLRLGGMDRSALDAMSLRDPLEFLGSCGEGGAASKWVLSRQNRSSGIPHQVCPRCLAENVTPYWTKDTRLSSVTQCMKHDAVLLSHCPSCDVQLTLHKMRTTALTHCETCKLDLRSVNRPTLSSSDRIPQHWWTTEIPTPHPCTTGYIKKRELWRGIRAILIVVCDPKFARGLLHVSMLKNHHPLLETIAAGPSIPFDLHRSEQRHSILVLAKWLIEKWDERVPKILTGFDIKNALRQASRVVDTNWTIEFFRREYSYLPLSPAERYASSFIPLA